MKDSYTIAEYQSVFPIHCKIPSDYITTPRLEALNNLRESLDIFIDIGNGRLRSIDSFEEDYLYNHSNHLHSIYYSIKTVEKEIHQPAPKNLDNLYKIQGALYHALLLENKYPAVIDNPETFEILFTAKEVWKSEDLSLDDLRDMVSTQHIYGLNLNGKLEHITVKGRHELSDNTLKEFQEFYLVTKRVNWPGDENSESQTFDRIEMAPFEEKTIPALPRDYIALENFLDLFRQDIKVDCTVTPSVPKHMIQSLIDAFIEGYPVYMETNENDKQEVVRVYNKADFTCANGRYFVLYKLEQGDQPASEELKLIEHYNTLNGTHKIESYPPTIELLEKRYTDGLQYKTYVLFKSEMEDNIDDPLCYLLAEIPLDSARTKLKEINSIITINDPDDIDEKYLEHMREQLDVMLDNSGSWSIGGSSLESKFKVLKKIDWSELQHESDCGMTAFNNIIDTLAFNQTIYANFRDMHQGLLYTNDVAVMRDNFLPYVETLYIVEEKNKTPYKFCHKKYKGGTECESQCDNCASHIKMLQQRKAAGKEEPNVNIREVYGEIIQFAVTKKQLADLGPKFVQDIINVTVGEENSAISDIEKYRMNGHIIYRLEGDTYYLINPTHKYSNGTYLIRSAKYELYFRKFDKLVENVKSWDFQDFVESGDVTHYGYEVNPFTEDELDKFLNVFSPERNHYGIAYEPDVERLYDMAGMTRKELVKLIPYVQNIYVKKVDNAAVKSEDAEETRNIYTLELHESCTAGDRSITALRVPGGWIYELYDADTNSLNAVFVPFNNDLQ